MVTGSGSRRACLWRACGVREVCVQCACSIPASVRAACLQGSQAALLPQAAVERAVRLLAQEDARRATEAAAASAAAASAPAQAARAAHAHAAHTPPTLDASRKRAPGEENEEPTKQGAKKQKPIYKTTGKEAARDASRGLKQTGIASFFSR